MEWFAQLSVLDLEQDRLITDEGFARLCTSPYGSDPLLADNRRRLRRTTRHVARNVHRHIVRQTR